MPVIPAVVVVKVFDSDTRSVLDSREYTNKHTVRNTNKHLLLHKVVTMGSQNITWERVPGGL